MKKTIIALILVSIFIYSCDATTNLAEGFSKTTSKSSSKPKEDNIFTGTTGLTIDFAKTAPPPRVFESSSFPILLRVRNIGAFSIDNTKSINEVSKIYMAVLSIGRERDYIQALTFQEKERLAVWQNTDNVASFNLNGKTQLNQKGDELIVSLNAKTGKLDPQSENKQSTLTATLCYPYRTSLSTTVCIDPDVAGARPTKKACSVKDQVFKSGQGAPVAITKIEPQMIPEVGKQPDTVTDVIIPQFIIYVENVGRGNSVDINNYYNVCTKTDFSSKEEQVLKNIWNAAYIRVYRSGTKEPKNELQCCPKKDGTCNDGDTSPGFIRFRDGKDFVRCTFQYKDSSDVIKRNSDAFTSPLLVEIDYGYVQTASVNFFIQKPLKY